MCRLRATNCQIKSEGICPSSSLADPFSDEEDNFEMNTLMETFASIQLDFYIPVDEEKEESIEVASIVDEFIHPSGGL